MSDTQLAQLTKAIQAMDKRFDGRLDAMDKRFDGRLDAMDKKFDKQFAELFKYMNKEFKAVRKDIVEVKDSVNTYSNAVDAFAKQTETYHHEMLTIGHKVDRHEKWHEQTAKAVGINLSA